MQHYGPGPQDDGRPGLSIVKTNDGSFLTLDAGAHHRKMQSVLHTNGSSATAGQGQGSNFQTIGNDRSEQSLLEPLGQSAAAGRPRGQAGAYQATSHRAKLLQRLPQNVKSKVRGLDSHLSLKRASATSLTQLATSQLHVLGRPSEPASVTNQPVLAAHRPRLAKPRDLDADPYGNQDLAQSAADFDPQPRPPGAAANTGTTNYYFVNVTAQPWE